MVEPRTPYSWDEKALEAASEILNSKALNYTQHMAMAQIAVLDAMQWAAPDRFVGVNKKAAPSMDLLACKEAARRLLVAIDANKLRVGFALTTELRAIADVLAAAGVLGLRHQTVSPADADGAPHG